MTVLKVKADSKSGRNSAGMSANKAGLMSRLSNYSGTPRPEISLRLLEARLRR